MIPLYLTNNTAYVWNVNDWFTLRSNYRICGALIGALPSFPRQNDFLGLPMALMLEEAKLLVEKGICELFDLPDINKMPSKTEKEEIKKIEERVLDEQIAELRKRKIEQLSQKIDIIVAGKKQKLLSKGITDETLDKQVLLQEEINKLPTIAPAHYLLHIPTEHHRKTVRRKLSIDTLESNTGTQKYLIFKDLWEKGHYITSGAKFSSDFLVYPGEPVKFHATYMVRCVDKQCTTFDPASLVAFGRLAVAVNKLAILAVVDSHGNVEYQTLQWHDSVNA